MDRGDIVLGWLTRVTLALTLLGVVAYDGISVGVARLSVEDTASAASRAAGAEWRTSRDVQRAYDAAVTHALEEDPHSFLPVDTFRVEADGSVRLSVERTAQTLVLRHIGPLAHWAHVRTVGSASPAS